MHINSYTISDNNILFMKENKDKLNESRDDYNRRVGRLLRLGSTKGVKWHSKLRNRSF